MSVHIHNVKNVDYHFKMAVGKNSEKENQISIKKKKQKKRLIVCLGDRFNFDL